MIEPVFDFSSDSVLLYDGVVRVKINRTQYDGTRKILLYFMPKSKVIIDTEFSDPRISALNNKSKVIFSINRQHIDVFPISQQLKIQQLGSAITLINPK